MHQPKGDFLVIVAEGIEVPQAVVPTLESAETWFREHGLTPHKGPLLGAVAAAALNPRTSRYFRAYWMALGK